MKVQIISDIHLEYYNKNFCDFKSIIKPEKDCKILFLAGDIGHIEHSTFRPFMDYVSENWNEIYYVCGNHEFYQTDTNINNCKTIEELEYEYDELFLEYWNIYYLHNNYNPETQVVYYIWDEETGILYFILGNTAWSFYNNSNTSNIILNDFNYIYTTNNNLKQTTIDTTYSLNKHFKCLNNLKLSFNDNKKEDSFKWDKIHKIEDKYADKIKDVKFICLTHFPFGNFNKVSHCDYHNQPVVLKDYFCNNIEKYKKYLNMYQIFIAGHTHYSYDYEEFHTRFISNQNGYNDELRIKNKNFKSDCVYEI